MNHTTPRTDPRVVRTRELLKDAVVELMEEMNVQKISVNRIAERAKINRVTFYLHYKDIPDMLEKMADEMVEDITRVVNSNDAGNSEPGEHEDWPVLENLLKYIAENARFYKTVLTSRRSSIFSDRLFNLIADMIAARVEKRVGAADTSQVSIQKDVATWYGSAALIGTIIAWLRNDMPYTPSYLAKQITSLRSK
ncbi:TetR/AcrR family transcriptional regulator C-terminal domain-containing protein [Paenibacillus sonchi]|uniref:TetR/AcrR family transcriptional regulator C-terminal domain-containing protein n=1 Tax=Paenibacillus sonchi TaxID=373687 RepID=A0A974P6U1_9BACL|nr:TetR/AcrR family transcriptional regulator [Paenibacillus sonchi]MCE3199598.1 TetR/AcrR family transcriptional regulator [Paenibacillus sonchi]QQZ58574.1 TetR/AcrR family transcriptional regulator C-terminal domain-containing protein [Paenibacillus sonchi]